MYIDNGIFIWYKCSKLLASLVDNLEYLGKYRHMCWYYQVPVNIIAVFHRIIMTYKKDGLRLL